METNSEFLPPQERNEPLRWNSAYKGVALHTLGKLTEKKLKREHPGLSDSSIKEEAQRKQDALEPYLDATDREVVDNFGIFSSENDPEVGFPYTRISIRKVADNASSSKKLKTDSKGNAEAFQKKRTAIVIFTPFSPLPGGDPSDPINTVYDRVLLSLPELKRKEDIEVYVLGLPTSKWGNVSRKWVDDLEKGVGIDGEEYGFAQHGRLYGEFLRPIFNKYLEDKNTKTNFIFRGDSMGTMLANKTAGELPEIWNNLQLLLDVPTGDHKPSGKTINLPFGGKIPLSAKGFQVVAGFGSEVLTRALLDSLVRKTLLGKRQNLAELTEVLRQKGMAPTESDEQNRLKKDAYKKEIKLLVKGTPMDTENFRSFVVQGMLDPATISIERIKTMLGRKKNQGFFKAGNMALGMGINYTHWMDRGRWADKWVRAIERYES